ncbi:MAG: dual specificity protein phosphatase family protein [Symbiobacterium sp.]|uniref:protein-tyrosine phosphatase family protein n=1 Tax=Symbiobacterium sp. TaxID=1971213 RepID=UPI003463856D
MQLDRLQAIQTVLWAYETLTDTLLSAAPTSGLSHVLALELHALHGGPEDLRRPPQTTLHSAEEALIDWLNRLQSVVASARDQVRAGEVDETLHTLDSVSAALVTYSAARRMRLDMLGEWARLADGGDVTADCWPAQRHRRVYTSSADLPRFEFSWIEDWLLAGRNPLTALDVKLLVALGVTHILDLREEKEWTPPKFGAEALDAIASMGLKRLHLPVRDGFSPSPEQFEAACDFLASVEHGRGERVYVHCRGGMERTACVLTAYVARRSGEPWQAVLAQLQRRRPKFRLWPDQERGLREWTGGGSSDRHGHR